MTTLYVTEEHAFVRKQGMTLVIKRSDGESTRIPLERVDQVVCVGDVSWSGAAVRELSDSGIGIACLSNHGQWVGRWEPRETKTVPLRRAQYRASDDPVLSLKLARGFVGGKIRNSRALLLRARRDGMLEGDREIDQLVRLRDMVETAGSLDILRGIEGEAASVYFRAYGRVISRNGFSFSKRVRRPPDDAANSMLSFGYTLLAANCSAAGRTVGFDAHIGFLHRDRYGRESLALDLCEEFRPIVVDALVAAIINKRVLTPGRLRDDTYRRHTQVSRPEAFSRALFAENGGHPTASGPAHPSVTSTRYRTPGTSDCQSANRRVGALRPIF